MKKKGIGSKALLLSLALVVALGGLGVGYAHWQGTLDITGTVQAGTINVGWYLWSGGDPGAGIDEVWNPPSGLPVGGVAPWQHIGTGVIVPSVVVCNSPIIPGGVNVPHYQTLTATITDAYPYYYVDWQVHLHNCGTLPVIVKPVVITSDPELNVTFPDGMPRKLHPCETEVFSLIVWCRQPDDPNPGDPGVVPGGTYSFDVLVEYVQAQ